MGKFVYVYRGGSVPETEEQQQAVMTAWMNWFGQLGAGIVDGGHPFGASATVGAESSADGASGLTGYSIVSADSLEAASAMAGSCPVLGDGGTVEVYETIDVM